MSPFYIAIRIGFTKGTCGRGIPTHYMAKQKGVGWRLDLSPTPFIRADVVKTYGVSAALYMAETPYVEAR